MSSNIHMLNRSQRKRLAGLSPDLSFPSGRGRTSTWSHLLGQHSPQLPFRPGCGHTYRMGSMILLVCHQEGKRQLPAEADTPLHPPEPLGWDGRAILPREQHSIPWVLPAHSPALFLFPASTNELSSINACLSPGWVPNGSAQECWPEANWCSFESSAVISEMGEKWL